ncbi:MAG: twin-arginine translocase TatA/TatE family subunit [Candidatus Dormibacteria bacterium]
MISPTHIFLLLVLILLALVVFGPKRLPELGSSVGRAIQEFKKASTSAAEELKSVTQVSAPPSNTVNATPTQVEPTVAATAPTDSSTPQ